MFSVFALKVCYHCEDIIISESLSVLCDVCSGDEAFYPNADTLGVGERKDSEEGINRMVEDLEKQYV